MKRAGSSRPGGLPAGASTRAVLERLAQVLISNGASPSQLSQQFARACRRAIPPPRPSRRAGLTSLDHSHVLPSDRKTSQVWRLTPEEFGTRARDLSL